MSKSAKISEEVNAPIERCFEVIAAIESYPDFIKDLVSAEVLDEQGNEVEAAFAVQIIKKLRYRIRIKKEPPHRLSWTYISGDFKDNQGGWVLTSLDGGKRTRLDYEVTIDLGLFVPQTIMNMLVGANLPAMMKAFRKRMEE